MNLLLDQDVYASTADMLRGLGHDVVTAGERGYATASDAELLRFAAREQRILVTRDRDYGALVFVDGMQTGMIYLRFRRAAAPARRSPRTGRDAAEPHAAGTGRRLRCC